MGTLRLSGASANAARTRLGLPAPPPKKVPRVPERKKAAATIDALATEFPTVFARINEAPITALKIGIHVDLRARGYSRKSIRRALKFYCDNPSYKRLVEIGAPRVGLDEIHGESE